MTGEARVTLNDEDLRELFALFSSPTDEELHQVFDPLHTNFYKRENPAGNAWRAVTYFLHRKRFKLSKNGVEFNLGASSGYSL